jgi:hypothetical protein
LHDGESGLEFGELRGSAHKTPPAQRHQALISLHPPKVISPMPTLPGRRPTRVRRRDASGQPG